MRPLRLLAVCAIVPALALAGCLGSSQKPLPLQEALGPAASLLGASPAPAVPALAFSTAVVVDKDLGGTEPSLAIDPDGRIFVAAPTGLVPNGPDHKFSGQFWRSQDGGKSFQHLEGLGAGGLYGPSVGGGDSDIASDAQGNLYAIDLWLGNVGLLTSQDHGDSWLKGSPITAASAGDDRQWIDVNQKTGQVFITVNSADTGLWVLRSDDQGLTFPVQTLAVPTADRGGCICPPGKLAVDETSGNVYLPYYLNPHGVGLAISKDGGATFTEMTVPGTDAARLPDQQSNELGGSFTVVQHDRAGNLYLVWESASEQGRRVMLQTSTDHGASWSAPLQVGQLAKGNQIFPWVAAGQAGHVAVAWYEVSPDDQGQRWDVRVAIASDGLVAHPDFAQGRMNADPILRGDYVREDLGDFFSIAVGPDGALRGVWNAVVDGKPTIQFGTQASGPLLGAPNALAAPSQGSLVPQEPIPPATPSVPPLPR
jgi:hypothetical protein